MPEAAENLTLADLAALNYTILVPYNGSIATGGDSLNGNLNVFYTVRLSGRFSGTIHSLSII